MRKREVNAAIAAATRVDSSALETAGFEQAKRELLGRIVAEPWHGPEPTPITVAGPPSQGLGARLLRRRYLALGTAIATAAAIAVLAGGIGAGPAGSPTSALGAGLARLAKVSPHLLLDSPGWRIEAASQTNASEGTILFAHPDGKLVSYLGGRLLISPVVRARLDWHTDSARKVHAPGSDFVPVAETSVLGAPARVSANAIPRLGTTKYVAVWAQAGRHLEFRSAAGSLSVFEHRLASLHLVPLGNWLRTLPTHHVIRSARRTSVEEPVFREIVFKCPRPLPPALAAHKSNPKVRFFEDQCGR